MGINPPVLYPCNMSAASPRGKAFAAMYRLMRGVTTLQQSRFKAAAFHRFWCRLCELRGEPEESLILFLAKHYFRLTFEVEGKTIRLRE